MIPHHQELSRDGRDDEFADLDAEGFITNAQNFSWL
jgi:hypothetical protein